MLRSIRPRLSYANVLATLAFVIALGGATTAVAAVVVSSNSQVAQNTISGHKPPTGDHANIISGSITTSDLAAAYQKTVKLSCPAGMMLASHAGLCFDTDTRISTFWETAFAACAQANLRLPTPGELAQLFNNVGAPQNEQWTDDTYQGPSGDVAISLGLQSNRSVTVDYGTASTLGYRCVTTPTNGNQ